MARTLRRGLLLPVLLVVLLVSFVGGGVAVVLTVRRRDFLRQLEAEVRRQLAELRPDLTDALSTRAARILAAQAALESGYGSTRQWSEGWNAWNVAAGSSWKGPTIGGGDLEYDDAGQVRRITQAWRRYVSLGAAVSDFFRVLALSRYAAARAALYRGDAANFAVQLRAGGYYTAPVEEYQTGLLAALDAADAAGAA